MSRTERSEGLFNVVTRNGELPLELDSLVNEVDATFIILHEDDEFPQITRDTPTIFVDVPLSCTIGFEDYVVVREDFSKAANFVYERLEVPVSHTREAIYQEELK